MAKFLDLKGEVVVNISAILGQQLFGVSNYNQQITIVQQPQKETLTLKEIKNKEKK